MLFIGTQCSNLYTSVDTPAKGRVTRPDLAFSFSQLIKFLQYPDDARLAAAYRVLAYVNGTINQGLSYHDPGAENRNKLSGWVDSDFASDIDTRQG